MKGSLQFIAICQKMAAINDGAEALSTLLERWTQLRAELGPGDSQTMETCGYLLVLAKKTSLPGSGVYLRRFGNLALQDWENLSSDSRLFQPVDQVQRLIGFHLDVSGNYDAANRSVALWKKVSLNRSATDPAAAASSGATGMLFQAKVEENFHHYQKAMELYQHGIVSAGGAKV